METTSDIDLQLPKTGLTLSTNGVLRKHGRGNIVIASFAMSEIKNIHCEKTMDYSFPIVLTTVFAALGVAAWLYIPSPGWSWAAVIACGAAVLISLVIIEGRKIVLETKNGTVAYGVIDSFEDAEGFVISVKQRLAERSL